jgi:hypothetical protein
MKLFKVSNLKVEEVEQASFKLEKDIQMLIEPNVETFFSGEWKSGTKGTLYVIELDKNSELEYLMFLLKQKYNEMV